MKKFVLISLIFIYSCENKISQLNESFEPIVLSEKESFEIVVSAEFKTYFALRFDFLNRVSDLLNKGYDAEFLSQVCFASINENQHDLFYETFFDSCFEGERYIVELSQAHQNLYNKFPVLQWIGTESDGNLSADDVKEFFLNIELNLNDGISGELIPLKKGQVVCGSYWNQVKLAGCAGLCSVSTAGAGTALCGWACWCMLCTENSSVADVIC